MDVTKTGSINDSDLNTTSEFSQVRIFSHNINMADTTAPNTPSTSINKVGSFIVLSIFGDNYGVMKIASHQEAAEEHLLRLAVDWVHDNIGKNNYVDTLNEEKLPKKVGFYVQNVKNISTTKTQILKRVNAIQVQEVETPGGWVASATKTFTEKLHGFFVVISTEISVVLETEHSQILKELAARVSKEYDTIMDDYRTKLTEVDIAANEKMAQLEATFRAEFDALADDKSHVTNELNDANDKIKEMAAKLHSLQTDLDNARDEVEQLRWTASKCHRVGIKTARSENNLTVKRSKEVEAKRDSAYKELLDEFTASPPSLKPPMAPMSKPLPPTTPSTRKPQRLLLTESTDDIDAVIKSGHCTIDLSSVTDPWSTDFDPEPHHN